MSRTPKSFSGGLGPYVYGKIEAFRAVYGPQNGPILYSSPCQHRYTVLSIPYRFLRLRTANRWLSAHTKDRQVGHRRQGLQLLACFGLRISPAHLPVCVRRAEIKGARKCSPARESNFIQHPSRWRTANLRSSSILVDRNKQQVAASSAAATDRQLHWHLDFASIMPKGNNDVAKRCSSESRYIACEAARGRVQSEVTTEVPMPIRLRAQAQISLGCT